MSGDPLNSSLDGKDSSGGEMSGTDEAPPAALGIGTEEGQGGMDALAAAAQQQQGLSEGPGGPPAETAGTNCRLFQAPGQLLQAPAGSNVQQQQLWPQMGLQLQQQLQPQQLHQQQLHQQQLHQQQLYQQQLHQQQLQLQRQQQWPPLQHLEVACSKHCQESNTTPHTHQLARQHNQSSWQKQMRQKELQSGQEPEASSGDCARTNSSHTAMAQHTLHWESSVGNLHRLQS